MKPKLFIGSSSEALDVANAIQQNLNYDAEVTVWNQGIFKLSSTSLNDLLVAVNKSDFAIFVFNPDDISIIRKQEHSTVRDNVIFELGLFIGKLGQKNVFYVIPENETIHLPTDLLGVNPGLYNSNRSDKNLLAALGPFCNQVRSQLKEFKYVNLKELQDESEEVKKIAVEKPFGYEHLILAELIESRLSRTRKLQENLHSGVYFVRSTQCKEDDYFSFFQETLEDFQRFLKVFKYLVGQEIDKALGLPGVPSKFSDLKYVADEISNLCVELFSWEVRNEQLSSIDELSKVKELLKGSSKMISSQIYKLPDEIRRVIKANQKPDKNSDECIISLKLDFPEELNMALEVFQDYYRKKGLS